jgi:monoamine oxidase
MPYGAASHAWVAGADAVAVMDTLRAFNLAGSNTKNIHVAGEAFSDFQGFIEGALRSAKAVVDVIAPAGTPATGARSPDGTPAERVDS